MKRHARSLVELLKKHFGVLKPILGAEIGVWRGELSVDLLRSLPNLTLFMIDPWESLVEGTPTMRKKIDEVIEAREQASKSTQYLKRSLMKTTSVQAASILMDHGVDLNFAFIDANHTYESVKEDIQAWSRLILPNGIMAGHDYNGVGDRRHGWGVKRAVDEAFGGRVGVLPGNVWWVVI